MKFAVLSLTLIGTSMARLTSTPTKPESERELLLVASSKAYMEGCLRDADCATGLVCNNLMNVCDVKDSYLAGSLCEDDSHCNDGDIKYCEKDPEDESISDAGFGLCLRTTSGALIADDSRSGYLGQCSLSSDCEAEFVCNTIWGRCDYNAAYQRYSLCKDDSHCDAGSTQYCNLNTKEELKSEGFGLCNRLQSGAIVTMCTEHEHCNGFGNVCGRESLYGHHCARVGGRGCKGGYQCLSNSCVDGKCAVKDESCWERDTLAYSQRSADCIPTAGCLVCNDWPQRTHSHTLADNEYLTPNSVCKYNLLSQHITGTFGIGESYTWDEDARKVTVTVQNKRSDSQKFCFDEWDFAVGCSGIDRYIC